MVNEQPAATLQANRQDVDLACGTVALIVEHAMVPNAKFPSGNRIWAKFLAVHRLGERVVNQVLFDLGDNPPSLSCCEVRQVPAGCRGKLEGERHDRAPSKSSLSLNPRT